MVGKILTSLTIALVIVVTAAVQTKAQSLPPFGMSYSFLDVDISKIADCKTGSRGATIRRSAFLPRYEEPGIREHVKAALAAMRQSGFQEIRTLVWFGGGANVSSDWFDVDRDRERAGRILRQYQEDAAAAGFSKMLIGFAPQGAASPACKIAEWGDCFTKDTLESTNAFIHAVRAALGSPPAIPTRFDIGPEQCAPANLPRELRRTLIAYLESVTKHYRQAFPEDATTASCSLTRFADGEPETDRIFSASGGGPAYYEIHAYKRPQYNTPAVLRAIFAKVGTKKPFVIGETSYGARDYLQAMIDEFRRSGANLEAVYFWPLREALDNCHVDTAPPYALYNATGGLDGRPK